MERMIWLGGAAASLYLGVLSITARRWWPLAYVWAVLFGAGTGLLVWDWPDPAVSFWWMLWLAYVVAVPIYKTVAARRRALGGSL